MPTIICSYCEYVGQGDDYEERLSDVEAHEEYCETRLAIEKTARRLMNKKEQMER